jgi:Domain of unknown function (DUF929)
LSLLAILLDDANRRGGCSEQRHEHVMVKRRRKRKSGALIAWVSVGVVVAIVLTFVLVKELSNSGNQRTSFGPTSPQVFDEVTQVPASVFNTVGVSSTLVVPHNVFAIGSHEPSFTEKVNGVVLPASFYYGAEFCPYCAATRWGLVIALSRFGTFANNRLYNMWSSATDSAGPNTPTFTFYGVKYSSPYFAFTGYEVEDRNGKALAVLPSNVHTLVNKYNQNLSFPFMDIANKTFLVNSAFDPLTLGGYTTQGAIASALKDTTSPVTQAIISTANYISAGICASAKNPPASVCHSSGVQAAATALGLKL